jgi:hypothetical protein
MRKSKQKFPFDSSPAKRAPFLILKSGRQLVKSADALKRAARHCTRAGEVEKLLHLAQITEAAAESVHTLGRSLLHRGLGV